jgi:hypothetical protein
MDKIKELLGKIGASKDLADALCEELDRYSNALKESYESELQDRIAKAKQICVEEVQKEKVNLARKVGIFLESKAKSIEQAMTKQRVAEESEATSLLKKTKSLLEGIELNGEVSSRELLALSKKAERYEKALGTIKEERDRAVDKANTANQIAVKMLKANQLMESKLKEAGLLTEAAAVCECGSPVAEGAKTCAKCAKTAKEGKEACEKCKKPGGLCTCKKGKVATEGRLDKGRKKPAQPRSTRRTLIESETPGKGRTSSGEPDIVKIASEMPEL